MHACNVWHNMLSRGCQRIGHHFKPSVHTLNTYRQKLKWRAMPNKMAEKVVVSNIASVHNLWNSKDPVFLLAQMTYVLTNVNSHIFGGHRTSFQAFSPYINYQSLILQIPTMFVSCLYCVCIVLRPDGWAGCAGGGRVFRRWPPGRHDVPLPVCRCCHPAPRGTPDCLLLLLQG